MRIVVIGAGLIGISTAYFLRDSGHEITVIDRNNGPGLDTSFANGGMLTPSQAGPWNTPGIGLKLLRSLGRNKSPLLINPATLISLLPWGLSFLKNSSSTLYRENHLKNAVLAEYSLQTLQQMTQQIPVNYDSSCKGTLKIFRSTHEFEQAHRMLESLNLDQVFYDLLDNNNVVRLEPSLSQVKDQIAGGIHYPRDEAGDAHQFCIEIARIASDHGVEFRYGTLINRLIRQGEFITGLDSSSGLVEADYFILAAGCYSPKLAGTVGITLPIKPVKGYSLTFKQQPGEMVPCIPVIDESRHIAITPFADRLRISGIAELCGYDTSINTKRTGMMIGFFRELYPHLSASVDQASIDSWSGLRPYCSDGVPILGKCGMSNLFLNTGHGHLGWTMAAGSGKLLSDMICKGKTEVDINSYNINRFHR